MKKIIITLVSIIASSMLCAETLGDSPGFPFTNGSSRERSTSTQTLLGSDIHVSGFGGPVTSFTQINDNLATFVGGRGAAVFNRTLVIGGGGYGLAYPTDRSDISGNSYQGTHDFLHMGYGGGIIGINFFQQSIINLSITSLIGGGALFFSEFADGSDTRYYKDGQNGNTDRDYSNFFIAEPNLLLHLNVTNWMRIGGGVSYRYTRGINSQDLTDNDFRTISAILAVDFGWF